MCCHCLLRPIYTFSKYHVSSHGSCLAKHHMKQAASPCESVSVDISKTFHFIILPFQPGSLGPSLLALGPFSLPSLLFAPSSLPVLLVHLCLLSCPSPVYLVMLGPLLSLSAQDSTRCHWLHSPSYPQQTLSGSVPQSGLVPTSFLYHVALHTAQLPSSCRSSHLSDRVQVEDGSGPHTG